VDPVDRNDWSFMFEVSVGPGEPTRVVLRPTIITDFHAQLARGPEREASVARMRRLCAALGTATQWRPDPGELEVTAHVRGPGQPSPGAW
jgi:poly-gamma-glutamate synthesis protein (capsule biosynthesis protein)